MNKRRREPVPVIGASALLVIFTVLCLTVFALLSLSTALTNARIADAAAQATLDYYAADAQAEALLARIRAGETPEGVTWNGQRCSYTCPMGERQLCVELETDGMDVTVLRWQTMPAGDWTPDASLPVWDGEF